MFGEDPFGTLPYGERFVSSASAPGAPTPGAAVKFLLMGLRILLLSTLGWLSA
jgi:hypothetical protein